MIFGIAAEMPLIIDLDFTFANTDLLHEGALWLLRHDPKALAVSILGLCRGRSAFKNTIASRAKYNLSQFSYNSGVIEYARRHKEAGGNVYLVTAADEQIAREVAYLYDFFDDSVGSSFNLNLTSWKKAQYLQDRFPDGFIYAGDSFADLPVWRASRGAIIVGHTPLLNCIVRRYNVRLLGNIPRPCASLQEWMKALRLHHWTKNLVIFIPAFLSRELASSGSRILLGFLILGVTTSSTYLINDIFDSEADRAHLTKRTRAIASSKISAMSAALVAFFGLMLGIGTSLILSSTFAYCIAAYTVITLLYTFKLKKEILIDLAVIGGLFVVRICAGMVIPLHPLSLWLCSFTMMFFSSMAAAKRHGDCQSNSKRALSIDTRRGYGPEDGPILLAFGLSTCIGAIILFIIYLKIEVSVPLMYHDSELLYFLPLILALWCLRIWKLSHLGALNDDPVVFAIFDKISWLYLAAGATLWLLAI